MMPKETAALTAAQASAERVKANPDHRDGVAGLIDASGRRPAVRVNVSLPADLPEAIDRVSDNRSRFLAEAARAKLREA